MSERQKVPKKRVAWRLAINSTVAVVQAALDAVLVVSGSSLLRQVSQNLCLARHGFCTIPKTDSGTAFQQRQWWDAYGCAARAS